MKFTLALIILITTNTVSFAKDSDPEIPFVLINTTVKDAKGKQVAKTMNGWAGGPLLWQSPGKTQYTMEQSQDTKMIKSSTITKIVKNTKKALCDAVENGEFKVWLKVDGGGKVLGIGVSGEGGIEVTVKCEKKS